MDTDTVVPHVVELIVTSISPKTGLNPAGGNIIIIDGENFPTNGDSRYNFSVMING